ncbi:MAG: hypothetical protein JWQ29_1218 [Phenylobacterium sp.]|nr:hypothetical protein [Phenylobacterium sp.]
MCGVTVAVRDGRVEAIRPDKANVWSRGHICPKGTTLGELHHDPDRIRQPMIRNGAAWVEAGWEEAFDHIRSGMSAVRRRHGQKSIGAYTGNMSGKGFALARHVRLLFEHARFGQRYSASTVDQIPKNVTSHLLYGDMWKIPVPDVDRTDLLVILGGNPAASKGSIFAHRDVMGAIRGLRARGGRLIVVDPVRTRTAEVADQWIAVRPGADAALLLAVARELFALDLVRLGHLEGLVEGVDALRKAIEPYTPERVSEFCGLPASVIRGLAAEIGAAPTAAVYGRIGTCTQEFGTLASWMVDVITILTGNLDRPGGSMWSTQVAPHLDLWPSFPADAPIRGAPSRVGGVASILGQHPASLIAEEIDTPGDGQLRALFTLGANPALSVPGSQRLSDALATLEYMVSVDIYINETTRHANVILPSPSFLEQPHWDAWAWPFALTSGGHYSEPLFEANDRPEEWRVLARLGAIIGGEADEDPEALDDAYFGRMCDFVGIDRKVAMAALPAHGPERVLDLCIRTGPFGDRFGENPDGLTLARFKAEPAGILLGPAPQQGAAAIATPSGKIDVAPDYLLGDLPRLDAAMARPPSELVLVSRRHLRSLNSWMHNLETLVKGKARCTLHIHPADAGRIGLHEGALARVESVAGSINIPVEITADIRPGVVSMPHGWGHGEPGSQMGIARRHPGVNYNQLAPAGLVDMASGNAVLNGIAVRVSPTKAA